MDVRRRVGMRRMVNVTLEQLASGALAPEVAAKALYAAGVPFNVIGRLTSTALAAAKASGQKRAVDAQAVQPRAA